MPPVPNVVVTDPALPLDVVYTEVITNGETTGHFIITRTWVATDACGNTAKGVQHITWIPDTFLECEILQPEPIECNSHGVLILSNVTGGTGPMSYEWRIVGEKCFIQGGQGTPELLIYMGWSEVKIILTVTDSFGCVSMCMMFLDCLDPSEMSLVDMPELLDLDEAADTVVPEIILASPDHQGGSIRNISLWPIPAKGMVNLSFESVGEEEVKFSFYNLLGRVVLTDKVNAVKGMNTQSFDVSNLQPGSYLLQMQSQKEILLKVVVILGKE
jgi:hypothetical protein